MDYAAIQHAARLARISALITIHELLMKAIRRSQTLDDFLTTINSALDHEMDSESQAQMLAWAVH